MQTDLSREQINTYALAEQHNMTLFILGKRVGCPYSFFYELRQQYPEDLLCRIANVFQISVAELHVEPKVNIDDLQGHIGLLTRLRRICNQLHISSKRFYSATGIMVTKAYMVNLSPETLKSLTAMFGVSKDFLLYGKNAEVTEKYLQENQAYLTWKLSGYNMGEERDLIISIAKQKHIPICTLEQSFDENDLPSYLLKTAGRRKYRPNMTSEEREKIAGILRIPVSELEDIHSIIDVEPSKLRPPAYLISLQYPSNLITLIESKYECEGITEEELTLAIQTLSEKQAEYVKERFVNHKTLQEIANEKGVSKQCVGDCINALLPKIVKNIQQSREGIVIKKPVPKKKLSYPDNILDVLRKHTALAGIDVTESMLERAAAGLSNEYKRLYKYFFREGKSVTEVRKILDMPIEYQSKLHNKRHSLVQRLVRYIKRRLKIEEIQSRN